MAWNDSGDKKPKDPWGKGDQSPPDLEEALRKLQKRFRQAFSGGGGNRPSSSGGDSGPANILIGFVLIVFALIWLLSGIYIVGPAEKAVVLRFGRYVDTVGPGPHWIPRFIYTRYIVNVQKVDNYTYGDSMLNKDENIVDVRVAIQYRVADPKNYLFNVVNPRESLKQATASALRQVVGHTTLDAVLTTGREKVRSGVSATLKEILEIYQAGLEVTDVALLPAKAPEEVKGAFDDAIKAQEDEVRFKNQARAYAAKVLPIAKGNAKRMLAEAQAYQEKVILNAQGDVAHFLAAYIPFKQYPDVTKSRMYISAVEEMLKNTSKILVTESAGNNILYLPLDKMIEQRRTQSTEKSKGNGNPPTDQAAVNLAGNNIGNTSYTGSRPSRVTRNSYTGRESE